MHCTVLKPLGPHLALMWESVPKLGSLEQALRKWLNEEGISRLLVAGVRYRHHPTWCHLSPIPGEEGEVWRGQEPALGYSARMA